MATHESPALTPEIQAILQSLVQTSVTAAIAAANAPKPPTQQELSDLQLAQQHREANAAGVIANIKNKRFAQTVCTHEHSKSAGGGSHGVWVKEEDPRSPGYIYCQKCEARVRPGEYNAEGLPYQRDRGAHFNTELFNQLFQDCGEQSGAIMG